MNKEELIDVIVAELKVLCEENGVDPQLANRDAVLFGSGSIIDSLMLVGLVIKVEEYVMERTGKEVQIIDESAIITEGQTPFENPTTLAELALQRADEG